MSYFRRTRATYRLLGSCGGASRVSIASDPLVLAHETHPRFHARLGVLALGDRAQVRALVFAQLCIGPLRVVNLRERTLGPIQHGAGNVGLRQICVGQVGVRQVRVEERGRPNVSALEVGAAHDGLLERDPAQVLSLPVRVVEVHAARDGDAPASLERRGAAALNLAVLRLLRALALACSYLLVLSRYASSIPALELLGRGELASGAVDVIGAKRGRCDRQRAAHQSSGHSGLGVRWQSRQPHFALCTWVREGYAL